MTPLPSSVPPHRGARRGPRARRGVSLIEIMVSMILLGIVMMSLGKLSVIVNQRGRGNDVAAKRTFVLQQQANYLGALPYDSLTKLNTTSADTISVAGGFKYKRLVTLTPGTNRTTVKVVVQPITGTYNSTVTDSLTLVRSKPSSGSALCTGC